MEATNGIKSSLIEKLAQSPSQFNFFQAVRLFDMRYITDDLLSERHKGSIGDNTLPHLEIMRLKHKVELAFPPTNVCDFVPPMDDTTTAKRTRPLLISSHFGLAGFSGPLPRYFTTLILEQKRLGNTTLSSLLDMFDHRLLSLYYRAWAKQRIFIGYEKQHHNENHPNLYEGILKSFHGNGLFLKKEQTVINQVCVFYAGLLSQQPRSASGLVRLLKSYLSLPITLRPYREEWLRLDKQAWSVLGKNNSYNTLGRTLLLGKKVSSARDFFTLIIGPLDYSTFWRFLTPSTFMDNLCEIIQYYINNNLNYTLNVVLKREAVPLCKLNADFMLGLNTWLSTKPSSMDKHDTFITSMKRRYQKRHTTTTGLKTSTQSETDHVCS